MLRSAPHILAATLLGALVTLSLAPAGAQDAAHPAWDGASRFTILFMGIDRRPNMPRTLAVRTDAILVVSLDPQSASIGILHIPRDVHLIPWGRTNYVRANTLLAEGERIAAGYGPKFAMDTLWNNLGIPVDGYVILDFTAFVKLVDAIGGIDIDVPYTIDDPAFPDMRDGYDPLYIRAGPHHFDGRMALKYIRTRHSDSDFERGERQIQVVAAIHARLLTAGIVPELVAQAPQLLADLEDNIYTDLTLNEMLRLGLFAWNVPRENVHTGAINREYSETVEFPSGARLMVIRGSRLYELMTGIFGSTYAG